MPVYYLETSAFLKRYKSEAGSEVIFSDKRPGEVFVTSQLSTLEVNSVAARLLHARLIRQRQYERMLGTFVQDLSSYGVIVLPLHPTLVTEAADLLPTCPLRTIDSLHFATAMRVRQTTPNEPFYLASADRDILAASAANGVSVMDPTASKASEALRELRSGG